MSDYRATGSKKSKTESAASSFATGNQTSKFQVPSFDPPHLEFPKMEVPAGFHEIAEKTVSQAKDNWEKMKVVTEGVTDMFETSYATAGKGAAAYGLKVIAAARANANAAFDYANGLLTVKSMSEAIELSATHACKQFDALSAQTKELAAVAQKVATATAEPIKASVAGAFKKVA